ncbi:MAG: D-lyxose/D-mannose family sugar isomerase [Verrucomicrobiaceae bacterium]|nr:D-lyxose/D-mannose family sugar isomerase [Verrucomicrobiaceae bacterium]
MKRSKINEMCREAKAVFEKHGWTLPPEPKWDFTDFGKDDIDNAALVLINLAEEKEYCEKLMYARPNQYTLCHAHKQKKEDIICRHGKFLIRVWDSEACENGKEITLNVNGKPTKIISGSDFVISAGSRITLTSGIYHEFTPVDPETIIGEVSTANDDVNDNFFTDTSVGRFPEIIEDEPVEFKLL